MLILESIFWVCIIILFYGYAGYGLLLYVFNAVRGIFRSHHQVSDAELPHVTFIIAAWNEAGILEQKLSNTVSLDYPSDKLQVICITDGSDDDSASIISQFPHVIHMHLPERKGKMAAINRAMQQVKSPITFFSDANALLNKAALVKMVAHFNQADVGGVAGEKIIVGHTGTSVGKSESLYWRYESFMKKQDANFHSVVGAAGELFAIRTRLWQPAAENLILDDFIITMQVRLKGYKFAYEPLAFAQETPSTSLVEERKRKVRIAAGAFQSMQYLKKSFRTHKSFTLGFQFFSRRILRWVVCPVLLPVCFFTNLLLVVNSHSLIYSSFLLLQCLFYTLACIGSLLVKNNRLPGWLHVPFYFVFMNSCMLEGSLVYFNGNHTVLWDKARRESLA